MTSYANISVHQRFLSQTSRANISIDIPQCSSPSFPSPSNTLERCVTVKGQGRSDKEDGRWLRRNKRNNRGRVVRTFVLTRTLVLIRICLFGSRFSSFP